MRKVAFVVKTKGLEFDDRVRKEALSLVSLGYSVKIYVQLNNEEIMPKRKMEKQMLN